MKLRIILFFVALIFSVQTYASDASDWDNAVKAYDNKDYNTALVTFTKFAKKGNPQAQMLVGSMWQSGMGVPQDKSWAYAYYHLALTNKDISYQGKAMDARAEIRKTMTNEEVDRGEELAANWVKGKWKYNQDKGAWEKESKAE